MEAGIFPWTPFDTPSLWAVPPATPSVWTTPSDFAVSGTAAPAVQAVMTLNLTSNSDLNNLLAGLLANNDPCGGEYAYEYNEANYTEYAVAELSVVGAFAGVMSLPSNAPYPEKILSGVGILVALGSVYFSFSDLMNVHQQC